MTATPAPRPDLVSRDFRLREFAVSAAHPELVEPVPVAFIPRIEQLAAHGLQPVRDALARPMRILSGYRSPELNKAVGGSPTSQHTQGEAADFACEDIRGAYLTVIGMVGAGKLPAIGQIIYYPSKSFVHMALSSPRFARATCCVHWPEHGLSYRAIDPYAAVFAALVPASIDPNASRLA
jgi:hypothetical protein